MATPLLSLRRLQRIPVPQSVLSSFVCRQCLRHSSSNSSSNIVRSTKQLNRNFFTVSKSPILSSSSRTHPFTKNPTFGPLFSTAPLSSQATISAAAGGAGAARAARASSFPEISSSSVAYWLLGSAASVFGIVVFGGLTRLTESGLSITEWRPVTGSLPPMTDADWESEFAKYRASPEFKILNSKMDLAAFKRIYFMEWTHRLWGRLIGLTFVLPAAYFVVRRRVSARTALHLAGISGLIGFQGFIGWWMVKSGLRDDLFTPGSHPRVSQYRLTAHLATAFACYTWMLTTAMRILGARRLHAASLVDPLKAFQAAAAASQQSSLRRFRIAATTVTGLIFTTAMSGALVAGLDAGLIYNEFPYMGLGLTPPQSELFDAFYSRLPDRSDLWWRNMLENPSTVQLDHRILATTTFSTIISLFIYSRTGRIAAVLPKSVSKAVTGLVHLALMQVTLGITTLLWMVPVPLAAAHQAGSLALLTGALLLGHRLKVPKSTLAMLERRVRQSPTTTASSAAKPIIKS